MVQDDPGAGDCGRVGPRSRRETSKKAKLEEERPRGAEAAGGGPQHASAYNSKARADISAAPIAD